MAGYLYTYNFESCPVSDIITAVTKQSCEESTDLRKQQQLSVQKLACCVCAASWLGVSPGHHHRSDREAAERYTYAALDLVSES